MRDITYIAGDATEPQGHRLKLIAHIVNDVGLWGKGFVLAISIRWTEPRCVYMQAQYGKRGDTDSPLGEVQFVPVSPDIIVANMVAQHKVRSRFNLAPIRYEALIDCLSNVCDYALEHNASVHMPRIGCGLAGGDWSSVEPLIRATLCAKDVDVFVYDLNGVPQEN